MGHLLPQHDPVIYFSWSHLYYITYDCLLASLGYPNTLLYWYNSDGIHLLGALYTVAMLS